MDPSGGAMKAPTTTPMDAARCASWKVPITPVGRPPHSSAMARSRGALQARTSTSAAIAARTGAAA